MVNNDSTPFPACPKTVPRSLAYLPAVRIFYSLRSKNSHVALKSLDLSVSMNSSVDAYAVLKSILLV